MMRRRIRTLILRHLPGLRGDAPGLTLIEIVVALSILVIALAAIYGLVNNAVRSFGMSEDFLDVQQNARVALEKFSEEARWTARLVNDATFFARPPGGVAPAPCTGDLCPESVNLEIPRSNPIIPDCTYYVRFARVAVDTFTREIRPDDTQGPPYGTAQCVAGAQTLASYVSGLTFDYCNGATPTPLCVNNSVAVTLAQVVRMKGEIVVTKQSGASTQTRRVGSDVVLRN
ncbi:MAG: PilW family protein, partial [Armatimonadota bacterium]